jgi:hypothetical protein
MHTYVCLLFMNGLIRVTPKAVHMYVHHDRKPVCIALLIMEKGRSEIGPFFKGGFLKEKGGFKNTLLRVDLFSSLTDTKHDSLST